MKLLRLNFAAAAIAGALALAAPLPPADAGTLNTTIHNGVQAVYQGAPSIGSSQFNLSVQSQPALSLQSGYGNNQADLIYTATRTLAASANETLDLYGGLTDPFGVTLNFARIKAIKIFAHTANTNSVVIGTATAPFLAGLGGTTPTFTVPPGGLFMVAAPVSGWTVADTVNDGLKIANSSSGTSITYDIVIIGASQ